MVTCNDIQTYAGDAIDRILPREVESDFFTHLSTCTSCRTAFELEQLTKSLIRSTLHSEIAPPHVSLQVKTSLQNEYRRFPAVFNVESSVIPLRTWFPVFAGSLALLVALIQFDRSELHDPPVQRASGDIVVQSAANFISFLSGSMKPEFSSTEAEAVQQFFQKARVGFPVTLIEQSDCNSYGACLSRENGIPVVHLFYTFGKETLYMAELDWHSPANKPIHLSPEAKTALQQSGWYIDTLRGTYPVILWMKDSVLCSAVSTMSKAKMMDVVRVGNSLDRSGSGKKAVSQRGR